MNKIELEQNDLEDALIMEGDDPNLTKWLRKRRKIIAKFERELNKHDKTERLVDQYKGVPKCR